jgi:cellulose synthase/poly-beta-1,6-N-acetylglucosamine synthase-like glycosyltransferase
MWQRAALKALVRPLADGRVGGVAGDQRYGDGEIEQKPAIDSAASDRAHGERTYWSFDRQLKAWQSRAGSAISATGAIYVVRRSLFRAPPADATDDFMISTEVIAQGKRLVFAADAVAIEPPAEEGAGEFRRKVRIITRGLRAVAYRRALLRPSRTGIYAVELLLHKLWRRLTWIPLGVLLALIPACWSAGGALAVFASLMASLLVAGLAGLAIPALARFRPVAIASYVLMVNSACAIAAFNALRGHRVSRWDSERATASATGRAS